MILRSLNGGILCFEALGLGRMCLGFRAVGDTIFSVEGFVDTAETCSADPSHGIKV